MKKAYEQPLYRVVNTVQDSSIADINVDLNELTSGASGDMGNIGDLFGGE